MCMIAKDISHTWGSQKTAVDWERNVVGRESIWVKINRLFTCLESNVVNKAS